jgi:hypothetical protein
MVVLAIIGVLATLTTSAAMQVISYQRSSTTEGTIQTVNSLLKRQWGVVIAQADKDTIPNAVVAMAGGDERRARVIWKKLRLKQAFPMNFTEALTPWKLPGAVVLQPADLPGLAAYKSAIAQSGLTPSSNPADWPRESAYCLVMALRQGFGGNTFSEDSFSATALASDAIGLRRFVDAWGNSLVFYRWPTDSTPNGPADELDKGSPKAPYDPNNSTTYFRDPLDPEGSLESSDWNNATNPGVKAFEQYCHLVHETNLSFLSRRYQRSHYLIPVIVSAGRDGVLGLRRPSSPLLPDPMAPDAAGGVADNLYSFRLRLGGRGD